MALIQWNDNFSVNVVEIDRQHQTLVRMINELDEAMTQGKGKDILGKIISGLTNYTVIHFATEEKYFAQFKYPETDIHQKEHAYFVKKVSEFKNGFDQGRIGLSIVIMNFLSDWLKNHIKESDKKFGPFLNEKGLR